MLYQCSSAQKGTVVLPQINGTKQPCMHVQCKCGYSVSKLEYSTSTSHIKLVMSTDDIPLYNAAGRFLLFRQVSTVSACVLRHVYFCQTRLNDREVICQDKKLLMHLTGAVDIVICNTAMQTLLDRYAKCYNNPSISSSSAASSKFILRTQGATALGMGSPSS